MARLFFIEVARLFQFCPAHFRLFADGERRTAARPQLSSLGQDGRRAGLRRRGVLILFRSRPMVKGICDALDPPHLKQTQSRS